MSAATTTARDGCAARRRGAALALLAAGLLLYAAAPARADCAADATPGQVRAHYARARSLESAGRGAQALAAYVAAQAYTCDANPVAAEAAVRAAHLARPFGEAAEARGDAIAAFDLYESGAWYADADRMLMKQLRERPDDLSLYDRTVAHFGQRALAAFAANNAARLAATGEYHAPQAVLQELRAMPAERIARALEREERALPDAYLSDTVALAQAQPQDPADAAGVQRALARAQAYAAKWPDDRLAQSRRELELARRYASRAPAEELAALQARIDARVVARAGLLVDRHAGAPKLLAAAIAYHEESAPERALAAPRVAAITARALQLGSGAERDRRLLLAADYYEAAGDEQRARAARGRAEAAARARLAPEIERMQRDAERLRASVGDPAQVAALRARAEAAGAALQRERAKVPSPERRESTARLERELGL